MKRLHKHSGKKLRRQQKRNISFLELIRLYSGTPVGV